MTVPIASIDHFDLVFVISNLKKCAQILIVMGGWGTDRRHFILDVIETFDINLGRWATSGSTLPRLMTGLRAANIDGRVLIFGKYILIHHKPYIKETYVFAGGAPYDKPDDILEYDPDDILEYDPEQDSLVPVGQKIKARAWHAVSVVKVQDYAPWCRHPQQPSSSARLSPVVLTLTFCFFRH